MRIWMAPNCPKNVTVLASLWLQIPSVWAKSTKPVRGLSVLELLDLCFKNTAMLDHPHLIFLDPKWPLQKAPNQKLAYAANVLPSGKLT